jgi:hydrogenase expression/formation protein HypC
MCLAIPGRVISIEPGTTPEFRTGIVDFGGVRKEVSLAFTPEASAGDYVLVHVGFALSVIDEKEAGKIFDDLARMGELAELEDSGP